MSCPLYHRKRTSTGPHRNKPDMAITSSPLLLHRVGLLLAQSGNRGSYPFSQRQPRTWDARGVYPPVICIVGNRVPLALSPVRDVRSVSTEMTLVEFDRCPLCPRKRTSVSAMTGPLCANSGLMQCSN